MNPTDDINATIDKGEFSIAQVIVVAIAVFLYMLDGFDIAAMSFTAHRISEVMSFSPEQLGVVFSAALAGMMLGAMFLAPMSDNFGRRPVVLLSLLVIGCSLLLTTLADNFWYLVMARMITGLGIGAMLASLTAITSEFSPEKYRGMTVIIVVAGYPLGAAAGGFISAPLMAMYGWESIFLVAGALTLSMLPLVYFFLPESIQFLLVKRPANVIEKINITLSKIQKPLVEKLPDLDSGVLDKRASVLSLFAKQYVKHTLMLWCSVFLCLMCLYFLLSWIPKLVIIAGFSEAEGIYASASFSIGGVIGTVILGILTSRMGLTNLISTFLLSSSVFLVLYAYCSGQFNLLASLAVIGFLFTSGYSGLYAVAARIYPVEIRATGIGWAVGVSRLGAVVGPYIGGILVSNEVSLEINFIITAVPILLAGLMIWRLRIQ